MAWKERRSSPKQQGTAKAGDATCATGWDNEAFLLSTWLHIASLLLTLTGTGNSAGSRLGQKAAENSTLW